MSGSYRPLTKEEREKYAAEIKASRKHCDSYVFGYRKREVMGDGEIITQIDWGHWVGVASCKINS